MIERPIRPEYLAAKIHAARSGEPEAESFAGQLPTQPRLLETLCFLQEMSRRPRRLWGFVDNLIETYPDRFQTAAMLAAGPPNKAGQWTLEQCLLVWKDEDLRNFREDPFRDYDEVRPPHPKPAEVDALSFEDWLLYFIGREVTAKDARGDDVQALALRAGLARFNREFMRENYCQRAALREGALASLLVDWCEQKSNACHAPWYCPGLLQTLFDFMDRHAVEAKRALAETEITKTVFRELDFARSQCVPVPIVGASRFGKTKAVSVYAEMHPGRVRLVTVPESNRERDFFAAHADAFGHEYNSTTHNSTPVAELKRAVEYIQRHLGLFLIYDESHYLVPLNYHKSTPPRRLNWIRSEVIDRGSACAFFATPQSYRETLAAYVAKTGYCMEQWLGRLAPAVVLPESLDRADVFAVAQKHFPDVAAPFLEKISARAMQSEGYLKNMEICVKRARFLAGEDGRSAIALADVQAALDYVMPASPSQAAPEISAPVRSAPVAILPPLRRAVSSPLQAGLNDDFPRRKTMPKVGEPEVVLAG